jgi:hypothetical protein
MYAAIALPIALVSGLLLSRGRGPAPRSRASSDSAERQPQVTAAPLAGTPLPEPPADTAPKAPPTAAPAAPVAEAAPPVQVLLGVAPTTAHVFMGERDLGRSPVSIDVPQGSLVTVEVRHPGYETRWLQLDGSEPRKSVELKRKKKKRSKAGVSEPTARDTFAPREPQHQAPTPAEIGGQLFVEPWQKP